jgi:predicted lipase
MNRFLLLALSSSIPVLLSAVTLTKNAGNFIISNNHYNITCGKSTDFSVKINKIGKSVVPAAMATPEFNVDNDLEKYDGRYNPSPASIANFRSKAVCKVVKNTPNEIQLEVSYNFYGGKVTELITFDNSCAINYNVKIANNVRLYSHNLQVWMIPGE